MDRSKRSFERFRDIFRLVQPKPVGRHFTFDQLFAITLDVLDENARPSIRPGKAREHDPRALGAQETLDDDRHRRHLPNPNLPEIGEGARRKNGCPNLPNRRFKFFRSGDRDGFKNAGERMSAAVLNRGRRPNDHAFARRLPKPQGVDRLHDRLEYSRGNPAGKNALTNLFASGSRVFGTGEQRVERLERGSEPDLFESALKSVARDDKARWNAMPETHEAAERRSFAAQQARIGCVAPAFAVARYGRRVAANSWSRPVGFVKAGDSSRKVPIAGSRRRSCSSSTRWLELGSARQALLWFMSMTLTCRPSAIWSGGVRTMPPSTG